MFHVKHLGDGSVLLQNRTVPFCDFVNHRDSVRIKKRKENICRKKGFLWAILFAFALSFQIKANHPQITYYLAIIVLGYGFAELYNHVREKKILKFLKVSGLLLLLGGLGIATNINHLWPTYEYSKYTMRGGSELAKEQGKQQEGLDIGYATSWSYSPEETPNLFIPNFTFPTNSNSTVCS